MLQIISLQINVFKNTNKDCHSCLDMFVFAGMHLKVLYFLLGSILNVRITVSGVVSKIEVSKIYVI